MSHLASAYDLPADWSPTQRYGPRRGGQAIVLGHWRAFDRIWSYPLWCPGVPLLDLKNHSVATAELLAKLLEGRFKPGTLDVLTLSSHGINEGGIALSRGNHLTAQTETKILSRMRKLFSPHATVILDSCFAGGTERELECQALADKLGATVIATAEESFLPTNLNWLGSLFPRKVRTQWKAFSPKATVR
jgi:hypothetical protein